MRGITNPTLALLESRLAPLCVPDDPVAVELPPGSEDWPAEIRERLTGTLRPAGVLIPVIERRDGLTVLLTRRSSALKHHASQIAFPGGGMEAADRSIVDTALRETHEEVGIAPSQVTVFGCLEAMPTVTGYAVTPVVGSVAPDAAFVLDRNEVELVFEVPLAFLLDPGNAQRAERDFRGQKVPIFEYRYGPHRIWGATAHMLMKLREKLY